MNKKIIKPGRRSIRLEHYDYSQPRAYFITICTQNRESLFGSISNDVMKLNRFGIVVQQFWENVVLHFNNVELDCHVVMPNHVHCILNLHSKIIVRGGHDDREDGYGNREDGHDDRAPTVGKIVAYYKYQTTKLINDLRGTGIKKVWQRNYYEHIIRNEKSLQKIREYIINNPRLWQKDKYFT